MHMAQACAQQGEGIHPTIDIIIELKVIPLHEGTIHPKHHTSKQVLEGFLGRQADHGREDGGCGDQPHHVDFCGLLQHHKGESGANGQGAEIPQDLGGMGPPSDRPRQFEEEPEHQLQAGIAAAEQQH